jgi:nitroimidazol reductase NimA-like FMN-containing flavoprotein (pyridoxamine 5'-phosphate oxidase superfamily)
MTPKDKDTILRLLAQHRIMTVATVRPDGWPQATTVGYASEGLVLYFLCGRQSQKAVNIASDNRISLVIDHDTSDPMGIEGLAMAARAYAVTDPAEMAKVLDLMGTIPGISDPASTGPLFDQAIHGRSRGRFHPRLSQRLRP